MYQEEERKYGQVVKIEKYKKNFTWNLKNSLCLIMYLLKYSKYWLECLLVIIEGGIKFKFRAVISCEELTLLPFREIMVSFSKIPVT